MMNRDKIQWIKKATLVCFFSVLLMVFLLPAAVYSEEYSIDFVSSLYEGDWERYIAASHVGPYFLNENTVVFLEDGTNLVMIDIGDNSVKKIDLNSRNRRLYKVKEAIIVSIDNVFYSFDGVALKLVHEDIPLKDGFSYDFKLGLYKTDSGKRRRIIIPGLGIMSAKTLFNIPVLAKSRNSVYFTVKEDVRSGPLYCYSLANDELELLRENVRYFTFISDDRLLLYTIYGVYSLSPFNEFPGDFVIIDANNNSEIFNSDKVFYENGYECTVGDFDYNGNGKIVAFGGFLKVKNGKIVESYKSVILLKIDKK